VKFIVYRNSDGMILRSGETLWETLSLQAQAGETATSDDADGATQYINVSTGAVTTRPTLTATWNKTSITANGSDTAIFGSTLPNPTTVIVGVPVSATTPEAEQVTTGTFSITTTIAGEYTVTITPPFPYIPVTQVITAS